MKNVLLVIVFMFSALYVLGQTCTLNVNLTSSSTSICSGGAVVLTAAVTGGTAPYSYVWNTGETTATINVNKAGTYNVSVTGRDAGCPPVTKSITITTAAVPNAPTASGQSVCLNTAATLTASAPGGTYQWYDALTGGNFLFSGNPFITPAIKSSTTYYVQTTVDGCTSQRTAVSVTLLARPTVTPASVCAGNTATLTASGGDSYQWYAAASGGSVISTDASFTTPPLLTTTTYYVVSTADGCSSARTAVTATVTPPPQTPVVTNTTVCAGSSANLHADAPNGIFDWFDVPVGGVSLISSPDYTTPPLTATTTYYVQTSLNGCVSARTPVTVKVNQIPLAPVVPDASVCPGTSATLAVTNPSGTYQWYDSLSGGTLLTTGPTYNTPPLTASITYYVQTVNGGCTSDTRTPVRVTIYQATPSPSVSGAIICYGSSTTLTAVFPGGNYQWYDAPALGNLLSSTNSFTTPPLTATTTYYVQTSVNGCVSARTPVTVTVLPLITAPSASNTSVCSGNSTALTASGASNGDYEWYDSPVAGNLLLISQIFITPPLTATTVYYVQTSSNGCASARTAVTVTVNPTPTSPNVTGATICPSTTAHLTASSSSGSIEWYDAETGGNLVNTGNIFDTPVLTTTTTYYVQATIGSCSSSRTPVTATVGSGPNPEFLYSAAIFCTFGSNQKPIIYNKAGGIFSATPAGLVFTDTQTGEINIAASKPGSYTISFASKGECPTTTSFMLTISDKAGTHFSYNGPYCQDGVDPFPSYSTGSSAGNFTATPAGLVFRDPVMGQINLGDSQPGTYTITNRTESTGRCSVSESTATVTIYQKVIVNAGSDQTVSPGSPVQLAGVISGATSATWSGGSGTFSKTSDLNAVYTPSATETKVTLTLTTNDPAGPCGPGSASVTITITAAPAMPIAPGASVCFGGSTNLSALGPGGTYRWYNAAKGGNLLQVGPVFDTPPLTVNTTYYVQTTLNGVTSARTPVTVTVTAAPAPPLALPQSVCAGSSTVLTATGSAGTYQWYDAPVGGNLVSVSDTYPTPQLTANTSYYVQSVVNTCISDRTKVDVTIKPVPVITSLPTGNVCTGNAQNYAITANMAGTTFLWSRDAVTGISNPAVTGQTSSTINEALVNTGSTNINVNYIITPIFDGCPGTPFNYTVTVYPAPIVTSTGTATVCNAAATMYAITFNIPGTSARWSRAAVPGISNVTVSNQAAPVIREVLFNTTNAPVKVTYVFTYGTSMCQGLTFSFVVTVNPSVKITSSATDPVCGGSPEAYDIKSNIPSATYSWSRDEVTGISNPAVTGQTSSTINETLVNTTTRAIKVRYNIIPSANGCDGSPFSYTVTVNPQPAKPAANSNSPVCLNGIIELSTPAVARATYLWTGPNGFSSTLQNPMIANVTAVNTGTYKLAVTANGCTSETSAVDVAVDALPKADAGKDISTCVTATSVQLAGNVSGGTTTGIWSTAGSGTFSPSSNMLDAVYIPSQQDKDAGKVVLTLASTSKDDCNPSISDMTIRFQPAPAADAGPDQSVCVQDPFINLTGRILIPGNGFWTGGTGSFSSPDQPITRYIPSAADIAAGSVKLTLHAANASICDVATDYIIISFLPPPTVNAGGTRYVLKGNTITLNPSVNDPNVTYLWSPNVDINDVTAKNPVITGTIDRTYTLTVTDSRGCVNKDETSIKVSPIIVAPNTFTPNNDGINDQWNIIGLIAYPAATVDVFDRYGQKVFHSISYPKAWDGTYNGKLLPTGTYYYVIDTKLNGLILSGYIALIR